MLTCFHAHPEQETQGRDDSQNDHCTNISRPCPLPDHDQYGKHHHMPDCIGDFCPTRQFGEPRYVLVIPRRKCQVENDECPTQRDEPSNGLMLQAVGNRQNMKSSGQSQPINCMPLRLTHQLNMVVCHKVPLTFPKSTFIMTLN